MDLSKLEILCCTKRFCCTLYSDFQRWIVKGEKNGLQFFSEETNVMTFLSLHKFEFKILAVK